MPASIRKKQGGTSPSREELEREAALELQRASGRPTGGPTVGEWTPPAFGQAPVTDAEGAAEGWGEDELDDDEEDDDEEGAVTELALNWLADQDRRGPRRSAEDMVVRVDVSSATAARDRALQAHLERQEMLKKAQVTPPWAKKPLTIGKPFSTKKHPLGKKAKKKAVAKKKKALAKKVGARKVAATRTVPMIDAESLPLEDYEALSAAQILSVLDQLDDDDLNLVGDYEEQHRNRPEILDAIDDLFEDPAAPPAKKKTVAKKVVVAKVTTKKAVAKKAVAKKAVAKKAVAKKATAPVASPDEDLPIENYDRLTPSQILMVLDELDDDDLDLVADYEAEHKNRSEILDAIDDLLEEPPPAPVKRTFVKKAAVKKVPAKKAAVKKVPVKKVVSKKAVSKKVPADKTVAKKVPARNVVARKAGVKKAGAEVAKATAKKVAVKKSPVKKGTVKKAGARKSVLR